MGFTIIKSEVYAVSNLFIIIYCIIQLKNIDEKRRIKNVFTVNKPDSISAFAGIFLNLTSVSLFTDIMSYFSLYFNDKSPKMLITNFLLL